jgi:BMFP domain-containing protein YqiC
MNQETPHSGAKPAFNLADFLQQISSHLPPGLVGLQEDFQKNIKATVTASLAKLNLVTREEFDVQAAVLARTRARLDMLETRVDELEKLLLPERPSAHAAPAANDDPPNLSDDPDQAG